MAMFKVPPEVQVGTELGHTPTAEAVTPLCHEAGSWPSLHPAHPGVMCMGSDPYS